MRPDESLPGRHQVIPVPPDSTPMPGLDPRIFVLKPRVNELGILRHEARTAPAERRE